MSLSTEALVAAFLAMIFAVLSLGAIAREQGAREPGSRTISAPTFVTAAASENSLSGSGDKDVLGFY
ncbi:MAG TPA: hypothetical protein VK493_08835 [Bryobacteraceae bacterium]|nr:hypothetical protein [Bryobacteraceae bacterium]